MSLSLQNKGFIKTAVAVAVALGATQVAQANSAEIQQLRAEVEQLRQAVQQSGASNKGVSVSTKSGTDVKFYGNVRIDGSYVVKGADDNWQDIQGGSEELKNALKVTPKATRFGFDFATPVGGEKVTGKIEADFLGSGANRNGNLRLRHAYFKYGNWTIGQTSSVFAGSHLPNIVDFNGIIGDDDVGRNPQVRYTAALADTTKLEVAAERGRTAERGAKGITIKSPALTARLTQSYGSNGSASVRAIVEPYKVDSVNKNVVGFAAAAGADYKVVNGLSVMADLTYGRGLGATFGTSKAYNVSGTQVNKNEYASIAGGLNYDITDQVSTSVGYGLVKMKDNGAYAKTVAASATGSAANKNVQQAWVNVTYSPVKPVEFAAEYAHGTRKVFNGTKFTDSRVNLMAKYKF